MTGLLTIGEVADLLRVSRMSVYRWVRAGALQAVRIGRNLRIQREDLESFLQARSTGGAA